MICVGIVIMWVEVLGGRERGLRNRDRKGETREGEILGLGILEEGWTRDRKSYMKQKGDSRGFRRLCEWMRQLKKEGEEFGRS